VEDLRKQVDDKSARLREAEDRLKKMKVVNDKLRVQSRKKSTNARENQENLINPPSTVASEQYNSHYTSVGGAKEEPVVKKATSQSQEHSF
jgi:hypothetical protein